MSSPGSAEGSTAEQTSNTQLDLLLASLFDEHESSPEPGSEGDYEDDDYSTLDSDETYDSELDGGYRRDMRERERRRHMDSCYQSYESEEEGFTEEEGEEDEEGEDGDEEDED
ncbi:hypothetical protein CI109_106249 [Kwoniella shandongensis]|uniref:Uncharacterized protein n=1 Tax=Kwoniella shandongensis TaxID=1734106 RepID=A0A5M6C041_9TREE|nr:uncharacterized protein CI109_003852 [Kwoniella shandongensis]KAA5527880.1 hypothetical protein CI109_003852 [Kwoniella shandongensis]